MHVESRVMLGYGGQNGNKHMPDKVGESMTKKKFCGSTVTNDKAVNMRIK
jgi:hypothetical protein